LRRGLGVEIDVVVGAGQASREIGAPPLEPVLLGELAQLALVSADQDGLGPDHLTLADADAPLLADGQDRSHQVLVGAHAARDAVHDDSELHAGSLHLWCGEGALRRVRRKRRPSTAITSWVSASGRQIAAALAMASFSIVNDSTTTAPS